LSCLLNTSSHTVNAGIYTLIWGHNMRTGSLTRHVLSCLSDRTQIGIIYSLKSVHVNAPFPIRTPSNSLTHFLSNSPPLYSCSVPQERTAGSGGREWRCHSDMSVRLTVRNQYCYCYCHGEMQLPASLPLLLLSGPPVHARYEVRSCIRTSLEACLCAFILYLCCPVRW
jgi:hypothetical protein